MPKAYEFTPEEYFEYEKKMREEERYRNIKPYEFYTELGVADVEAPTPRTGREEGFTFSCLGLESRSWSSWVKAQGGMRHPDSGWNVIREHGVAKYYGPRLNRTKNYLKNMQIWARICRERIEARPACPKCRSCYMSIVFRGNHQYYWKCLNPIHQELGEKAPCKSWDTGLSEESLKVVKKKREARRKYNLKRIRENKKPFGEARKNRKKWRNRTPQVAHAHA
jgi:hypothetical protein